MMWAIVCMNDVLVEGCDEECVKLGISRLRTSFFVTGANRT
jgi:hypothetical protein